MVSGSVSGVREEPGPAAGGTRPVQVQTNQRDRTDLVDQYVAVGEYTGQL